MKRSQQLAIGLLACLVSAKAGADPCGMVPPIYDGPGPALTRVGEQMTYAFFKNGTETFVIRPGFSGKVDNFGMLIPFPTAPAVRKVSDEIFSHLAAAVDPPEVIIDLRPPEPMDYESAAEEMPSAAADDGGGELTYDSVKVLKQEAVGMYEVTTLQAGSPKALKRWMDNNGYVYPEGMDRPVADYVALKWAFVAVKTRVGAAQQVKPRPGMRQVNPALPSGSSFDGQVQAMGFRFRTPSPVVPMRLSAFNAGQTRNIVYFVAEDPVRIDGLDPALIRRQLTGNELHRNVTGPLPVRIIGGGLGDVPPERFDGLSNQRDATRHLGHARTLLASDLVAAKSGDLALPFEEQEKVLLRIDEALDLRGPHVDELRQKALKLSRDQALKASSESLKTMTLTVLDGDFPRKHLAEKNLTFSRFVMPAQRNGPHTYHGSRKGPAYAQQGVIVWDAKHPRHRSKPRLPWWRVQ